WLLAHHPAPEEHRAEDSTLGSPGTQLVVRRLACGRRQAPSLWRRERRRGVEHLETVAELREREEIAVVVLAPPHGLGRTAELPRGAAHGVDLRAPVEREQPLPAGARKLGRDQFGVTEQDAAAPGGVVLRERGGHLRVGLAFARVQRSMLAIAEGLA